MKIRYSDKELEELWLNFEDTPIDENENIDDDFMFWEKGTFREDIWHWFDEMHSRGVGWLMNDLEDEE